MFDNEQDCSELLALISQIVNSRSNNKDKLQLVTDLLCRRVDRYDWVGFYLANQSEKTLSLGPFTGETTEHTKIGYGEGVCGQSAETKRQLVVQDVSVEENYLSCSPKVKSEIVIPMFVDGSFVGELDIDSHMVNSFTKEDREFLQKVADLAAEVM